MDTLSPAFASLSPLLAPLAASFIAHGFPPSIDAFYELALDELRAFLDEPELAGVTKLQRIVLLARHAAGRPTAL